MLAPCSASPTLWGLWPTRIYHRHNDPKDRGYSIEENLAFLPTRSEKNIASVAVALSLPALLCLLLNRLYSWNVSCKRSQGALLALFTGLEALAMIYYAWPTAPSSARCVPSPNSELHQALSVILFGVWWHGSTLSRSHPTGTRST